MTYQEAAQSALDIQDACNLSGVVYSFVKALGAVREEAQRQNQGTEWINTNPIVSLYLDKLASLNRIQTDFVAVMGAYDQIAKILDAEAA